MNMKLPVCLVFFLSMASVAFAEEVAIVGTIQQPVHLSKSTSGTLRALNQMMIPLLKIQLSDKAQAAITDRITDAQLDSKKSNSVTGIEKQIQLDMNGVPVLNQGNHGTCVTFATTAAIDAALGKGDYISQVCQLTLGRYLENNTYTSSGWNGSWGRIVLSQMDVFGMVTKANQRLFGCAGLTEYPISGDSPTVELSLADYHVISSPLPQDQIGWSSILEAYEVTSDEIDMDYTLSLVKQALNAGDRLTFGTLLLDVNQGVAGAVGTHNEKFDTWLLTPEIANDINNQAEFAGHEMVITGYSDGAIAADEQGRVYHGLLTLRNSWGPKIGDKGNFYMSYDYFKALLLEVQRIRHLV